KNVRMLGPIHLKLPDGYPSGKEKGPVPTVAPRCESERAAYQHNRIHIRHAAAQAGLSILRLRPVTFRAPEPPLIIRRLDGSIPFQEISTRRPRDLLFTRFKFLSTPRVFSTCVSCSRGWRRILS